MPWYNDGAGPNFKGPSIKANTVLSKEIAEQVALEFVPMRFDLGTPNQAMDYLEFKKNGSDFRMNDSIRIQTSVEKIEMERDEQRVELAALEKLKETQEQAYKEAFALGLEEGRKEAFQKVSRELASRMEDLDKLFISVKELKKGLVDFNETHLVKLTFQIATRLAKVHIQGNEEVIVQILRDAVSLAQDEEDVTIQVSPLQVQFLETLKNETGREFEFLKKVKFEASKDVSDGGCVVETNYGEIDARIEQRIEQLWVTLSESLHPVKNRIAS